MRILEILVLTTAAMLASELGASAQSQPATATAPPSGSLPANTTSPAAAATTARSAPVAASAAVQAPPEHVVVHGQAQNDGVAAGLDAVVCNSEPPKTGSRLGGARECHTVREWNERQKQSQTILDSIQMRGLNTPGH